MITNDIKTDWSKIPGPNFFGPDGSVKDINDWLIIVKSHVLLTSAVQITRLEGNEPMFFAEAKRKSVRMLEERVYGEVRHRLLALRNDIRFNLERHALGEKDRVLSKYDEIIELLAPSITP